MILPVYSHNKINLEYLRSFDNEKLLKQLDQAGIFWFDLLIRGPYSKDDSDYHHETLAYWENARDLLELIAKERNLIS
jgi:hypothetical protein